MKRTQWMLLIVLTLPTGTPERAPAVAKLATELAQWLQETPDERKPKG